ncbi:MAG: VOC family protein [Acidobacteriota bacterium]
MDNSEKFVQGTIGWIDLTIDDADKIKNFYSEVVGWQAEPVDMGGYNDFTMKTSNGEAITGVCNARGVNANLPAQWLIYINVVDIEKSIDRCIGLGGKVVAAIKVMGKQGRYCVIQDPAGAVVALFEPSQK